MVAALYDRDPVRNAPPTVWVADTNTEHGERQLPPDAVASLKILFTTIDPHETNAGEISARGTKVLEYLTAIEVNSVSELLLFSPDGFPYDESVDEGKQLSAGAKNFLRGFLDVNSRHLPLVAEVNPKGKGGKSNASTEATNVATAAYAAQRAIAYEEETLTVCLDRLLGGKEVERDSVGKLVQPPELENFPVSMLPPAQAVRKLLSLRQRSPAYFPTEKLHRLWGPQYVRKSFTDTREWGSSANFQVALRSFLFGLMYIRTDPLDDKSAPALIDMAGTLTYCQILGKLIHDENMAVATQYETQFREALLERSQHASAHSPAPVFTGPNSIWMELDSKILDEARKTAPTKANTAVEPPAAKTKGGKGAKGGKGVKPPPDLHAAPRPPMPPVQQVNPAPGAYFPAYAQMPGFPTHPPTIPYGPMPAQPIPGYGGPYDPQQYYPNLTWPPPDNPAAKKGGGKK